MKRGVSDLETLRLAELGLLTAGLIHELRQPVFAVKALAQLASASPERAAELMHDVLGQTATLEALLDGYGDFSRRPTETSEVFDLATPLRSARVVIEHRAHAGGVAVEVRVPDAVAVRGSVLAVQQALVNLGQNAIDALAGQPDGRLVITGAARDGGGVLTVSDNGPGLPGHIRAHLFEPFRTTKVHGTGLGLSITRELCVACGATLRLVDGEGTTWEIALSGPGDG